ncbi:hypothetical protein GPJ56_004154 [Histomonas meleagridis]|uniref:uncharacterized protein n=1 Tax=Histomonas meleagridis TaxID=135588 RepID=UPI0035597F02|nr:hypothetical protein GPJ56_004154 [Histomonas meleagridis]KAH0801495.1 hypothetical protein GO595_005747 [Histomonas meleagridis]
MNFRQAQIAQSEVLILIRGYKRTGKSSLMKRMGGQQFSEEYTPTPLTQTSKIKWIPPSSPDTIVNITLMDTVSMSPALTTTTQGVPNGIIILYDPRESESVTYAIKVIEQTQPNIPIALLTNFQDVITASLHPSFNKFLNRCYSIESSMATNLGMSEISNWIEIPWRLGIYQAYHQLLSFSTKEILRLNSLFQPGRDPSVRTSKPKNDEDEFWSDDDNYGKFQSNKIPDDYEISLYPKDYNINQTTQQRGEDDDLMNSIIQSTSNPKSEEQQKPSRRKKGHRSKGTRAHARNSQRQKNMQPKVIPSENEIRIQQQQQQQTNANAIMNTNMNASSGSSMQHVGYDSL